jgi:transposase
MSIESKGSPLYIFVSHNKNHQRKGAFMEQVKQRDFKGQVFFIGIDVHKKNWRVTILMKEMELKTFSMNPSPEELARHLHQNYPGGEFKSAYEAGFSGFWTHRRLSNLGIDNIVVHAADIPTTSKEKSQKSDAIDSRKIARELRNGSLRKIWIPEPALQDLRSLCRLRHKLTRDQSRTKNRIKMYLHFKGIPIPEEDEICHWSGAFIAWLESIEFDNQTARDCLLGHVQELKNLKAQIADVLKKLRRYSQEPEIKEIVHDCLRSVRGIGFITAITLYTELGDLNRFPRLDQMASFVGLVPSVSSSGDKEYIRGISDRHNRYLRYLLIEAAWVAVRKDPAMTLAFKQLSKRMSNKNAIIRIAKKLLNRVRYVWINRRPYVDSVC